MVNTDSLTYITSEKVGFFIGKVIRYFIIGGVVIFIGGKLGRSTPSQPPSAPPAP